MLSRIPHRDFDAALHRDWEWTLNGDRANKRTRDHLQDSLERDGWLHGACPYCRDALGHAHVGNDREVEPENGTWRSYSVRTCPTCAFWQFRGSEASSACMDSPCAALATSVAGRFCPDLPEGCRTELAQFLRRNPSAWNSMPPTKLERVVAEVFRANHAGAEVRHVGGPGDRGVDVMFVDAGGTTYLIQVKRRGSPRKSEGFSTLQSILGAMVVHGQPRGIIVTTATSFSRMARLERQRAEDAGFFVKLVDRGVLDWMLGSMLPDRPWRAALTLECFSLLDASVREELGRQLADGDTLG